MGIISAKDSSFSSGYIFSQKSSDKNRPDGFKHQNKIQIIKNEYNNVNILIDFTQIPVQKVGVGIYGLNLIRTISKLDYTNNYFIIAQDDDPSLDSIQRPRFNLVKVKSRFFRKLPIRFILEQAYLPYFVIKHKIDVIHSLHYSFPIFARAKKIVTICDMTFFKYPAMHTPIKGYYFRFFIRLVPLLVDEIIAISKSTLNDFKSIFPRWKNKGRVVYLGSNDGFRLGLDKNKVEAVKIFFGISQEYLLFVGTIEPRKNIKNLILAFDKFSKSNHDYQLVIAGKKGWYCNEVLDLAKKFNLGNKVIFTGYIKEEDKLFLISGAKIFIYPSIYEGFGIPVLEALACGIPTVTSNVSSLPEIAGEAALLMDSSNAETIYSSIMKLVQDGTLYASLKQKSIEQAKKFSWEKMAQESIAVYNDLS